MEDILKRLLEAERQAEERVRQADEERKRMIQAALDQARAMEIEFEAQVEARRKPILAAAEEGARRRMAEQDEAAALKQQELRQRAAENEEAAVQAALDLLMGKV
jgi:V/A-type H+/Na+-transporting ATPase subunit G/H